MKKNYISNSSESVRMFKSSLLEGLSKIHFAVPLFIFIPAIAFFAVLPFKYEITVPSFIGYFALAKNRLKLYSVAYLNPYVSV